MNKTTQLRSMLYSPGLEFLMEAHNGLSARIAQDAGFRGIWASGRAGRRWTSTPSKAKARSRPWPIYRTWC